MNAESEADRAWRSALPKKRMAAGAIIRDQTSRVLLVKPTYKKSWEIPGGIVEADESPLGCCIRELQEELGVQHPVGRLLAVDWSGARAEKQEAVFFLFDGGVHDLPYFDDLRIADRELSEWRLVSPTELDNYLPAELATRVATTLDPKAGVYLENGQSTLTTAGASWE